MTTQTLKALAEFGEFSAAGIAVFALYMALYMWITKPKEIELIRAGNVAASITVLGSALGFVIPLAGVIFYSRDLVDMSIWSIVILIVQTALYFLVRKLIPRLDEAIERGNIADALFLATLSVTIGIILAASVTGFTTTN